MEYNLFWTGQKEYRQHGVGIVIHRLLDMVIDNILNLSKRLIAAKIVVCGYNIQVISAYVPTEKKFCFQKKVLHKIN